MHCAAFAAVGALCHLVGSWSTSASPANSKSSYHSRSESWRHIYNSAWSIGLPLIGDGGVNDVRWGGLVFKVGVSVGVTPVAVNSHAYSRQAPKAAIAAFRTGTARISLLLKCQGGLQCNISIWRALPARGTISARSSRRANNAFASSP